MWSKLATSTDIAEEQSLFVRPESYAPRYPTVPKRKLVAISSLCPSQHHPSLAKTTLPTSSELRSTPSRGSSMQPGELQQPSSSASSSPLSSSSLGKQSGRDSHQLLQFRRTSGKISVLPEWKSKCVNIPSNRRRRKEQQCQHPQPFQCHAHRRSSFLLRPA